MSLHDNNPKYLLKFSYNIALTYLIKKYYKELLLLPGNSTPENIAIDITSNLLSKNNSGKIYLINSLNKFNNDISNENDYEYYLIKIIWEKVDKVISLEFSKCENDKNSWNTSEINKNFSINR